jgi:hypothetical protein
MVNSIWDYIKASKFFPTYCPDIKDWRKKMTGKNGRGNPLSFSQVDRNEIKVGMKKLFADLKNKRNGNRIT